MAGRARHCAQELRQQASLRVAGGFLPLEVPHVGYADRKFDSPSDKIEFYSSRSLAFQTGGGPRVRVQNGSSSEVFPARRLYVEVRNGSFSRSNRRNDSQRTVQWPGLDARGHRVLVYGYRPPPHPHRANTPAGSSLNLLDRALSACMEIARVHRNARCPDVDLPLGLRPACLGKRGSAPITRMALPIPPSGRPMRG